MKHSVFITRSGFAASLAMNVALAGWIGCYAIRPDAEPQGNGRSVAAEVVDRQPAAAPEPSAEPKPFRWEQVESSDYATYVANLRAIGCPEQTVREIITADVGSLYAAKTREVEAAYPDSSAREQRLRSMEREKIGFVDRILMSTPAASNAGAVKPEAAVLAGTSVAAGAHPETAGGASAASASAGTASSGDADAMPVLAEQQVPSGEPDVRALYGWNYFNQQQIQALQAAEASSGQ